MEKKVNKRHFRDYATEDDIRDYVKWVFATYKNKTDIAKWLGDQIFGRALQQNETLNKTEKVYRLDDEVLQHKARLLAEAQKNASTNT